MKPYLIFDYDGTIVDSRTMWGTAFLQTMKKLGHPITEQELMAKMGPKTKELIEIFLPENEKRRAAEGKEIIDKIVSSDSGLKLAPLCPGAKETLKRLKANGHKMSLITNSDAAFVYESLKRFGLLNDIWDLVITADDPFLKKEESFKFITDVLELKTENVFYIADKVSDVVLSKNAGVRSVIVSNQCSWDSEEKIKAVGPDYLIKDLKELEKFLK